MPQIKKIPSKLFLRATLLIFAYFLLFYILFEYYFSDSGNSENNLPFLPYIVVHFDLKGAPPKIRYLKSILPMLKEHGVNSLLIEYEDMFPYEGKLVNISAFNCYDKTELTNFLSYAKYLGFEIIPLVQTFGHMEFVLKLEEFSHLRERPDYPDSICPSKIESKMLISQIIEQVINLHNRVSPIKFIHIGCDEVYGINFCNHCKHRKLNKELIFTNHVLSVTKVIKMKYPNVTVLIWDDMLRSIKPHELIHLKLKGHVEPVYWNYEPQLKQTQINLYKYHINSKNTWVASAFKGADGRFTSIPNVTARFLNLFSWLKLIHGYRVDATTRSYSFKGIVLTGWSRYAHLEPLCELLPVSIPSLILNLLTIETFKAEVSEKIVIDWRDFYFNFVSNRWYRALNCTGTHKLKANVVDFEECYFNEKAIYDIVGSLNNINNDFIHTLVEKYSDGVLQQFNIKYENYNPTNLKLHEKIFVTLQRNYSQIENRLRKILNSYYDKDVIEEYVYLKIKNQKSLITEILKNSRIKRNLKYWQRRYSKGVTN